MSLYLLSNKYNVVGIYWWGAMTV